MATLRKRVNITFTKEFKLEAVRLVQTSGKSMMQVARELGIADSTLCHWRKQLTQTGADAFPGSRHQSALEEESRRLKRELEIARLARDILKNRLLSSHEASREIPGHPSV